MKIPLKQYWDLLARHIQPQKARFAVLTALLLTSIGMQIFNPQIMRRFIDAAQSGAAIQSLMVWAAIYIGLALAQQVIAIGASYFGEVVAWTATNALRGELARHCIYLDMTFHNNMPPGKLIERIDGDVMELSNFFSQLVIRVVGNVLLLIGILAALALEDWRLGAEFCVLAIVALFALVRVSALAVPYQKSFRESTAELFGYLEERLSGTEDVRSSGAVDFVLRGLYRLAYVNLGLWRKTNQMYFWVESVGSVMIILGQMMALVSSYLLIRADMITIGTAFLIVHYVNLLGRPINELTRQADNLKNIGAATERLAELCAIGNKITDGSGTVIPDGPLTLHFDDVSFAYAEDEPVLKDVAFHLEPGKALGLLGRTGSGKTTLARLIFRLYDPRQGAIRLDGVDIRDAHLKALRGRVAMVTQDVQLFQATVRDNLTFFDHTISDERIQAVIEELELADWYNSLPKGLDTKLETGGRGLSAGEAQLLAFTRIFLRDPGLVILDEASSRLDPATEQLIERAVDKLLQDRTAIIIAHRLGTVQRADEIMILQDGAVIEHGDRARLASDANSQFYHLLQTGLEEVLA